jgi:phospholipase C
VVPAGPHAGPIPVVAATLKSRSVKLTLANDGNKSLVYTVTRNDYVGRTQKVTVPPGGQKTLNWPANQDGYYDVVITANTGDGFRRRYAGRLA